MTSYGDVGTGHDPEQVTKTKHGENESADTQPEALVRHADIIKKTGQDFIKNPAKTDDVSQMPHAVPLSDTSSGGEHAGRCKVDRDLRARC